MKKSNIRIIQIKKFDIEISAKEAQDILDDIEFFERHKDVLNGATKQLKKYLEDLVYEDSKVYK